MELYRSANGPNWRDNDGWSSDRPIVEWYGITTDPNSGLVTIIDLETNFLMGSIPESI